MILTSILEAALEKAVSTGADYAEIFAENTTTGLVNLVNDNVKDALKQHSIGVGVRVFKGLRSAYACSSGLSAESVMGAAAKAAAAIAASSEEKDIHLVDSTCANLSPAQRIGSSLPLDDKIVLAKRAYRAARAYSSEIAQSTVRLLDYDRNILIATSDGLKVSDRQVRSRILINAIASAGNENQVGYIAPGASKGYEFFDEIDVEAAAAGAARQAVTMLHADYCPAGRMPVAIDNGFGGVIFHEACGHSLEATSVAKGMSEFTGKLGQKIASDKVTAIDDGTIPGAWGTVNIDDEGTPSRRRVLIENGVLKSYMIDKLNGRRMGMESTASSRRQDYTFAPTSRMSNTFLAPGTDSDEAIIGSMEYGLYAKRMGGGSVNPVTGEFNFSVTEGYLVRNGQICEPVRGASLIGKGSEVIRDIDMVGKNLRREQGVCGSLSGSVPTDVGQPMIRVSEITVGGRK
jgi:TldD protein